jgi:nitroreductase
MEISKALLERRTIRKFTQVKINPEDLKELIEYARLAAYPANMQPLKFAIIQEDKILKSIFPFTKWAGYLPQTGTPTPDERPTAYIAVLGDKSIKNSFEVEAGAAITSIILGAHDKGIASCWLGAINRTELLKLFKLSEDDYSLLYLVALGYPAQKSYVCDMIDDDVKYYESSDKTIKVPKRSINDILISI